MEATLLDPFEAERPEVVVPLPATQDLTDPARVVQLEPGVRVRAMRAPHAGAVGTLLHLMPGVITLPSGILARGAMVELEEVGSVAIPLANIEVIV